MKEDVFNQYVERVSDLFGIKKEDLFTKSKKREIVDARQLVYYLCAKRPMRISYIQKYFKDNGYDIVHSSIIHGINIMNERVKDDKDYYTIIQDINKAVFI
jgi:chromosomal replication initiator protein